MRGSAGKAEQLITAPNEAAAALVPQDICVRHNKPLRLPDKSPNVAPEIVCLFTRIWLNQLGWGWLAQRAKGTANPEDIKPIFHDK